MRECRLFPRESGVAWRGKRLNRQARQLACVVMLQLALCFPLTAAQAFPALPSSFYGYVTLNGANVPDGTAVEALIAGQVQGVGYTQTYQGQSVYSLDVPGDDSGTAARDGGQEGDVVQFQVGGLATVGSGIWHSGVNTQVDLAVTSQEELAVLHPTPTALPSQTAIAPSVAANGASQATVTATPTTPAGLANASPTPTAPSATASPAPAEEETVVASVQPAAQSNPNELQTSTARNTSTPVAAIDAAAGPSHAGPILGGAALFVAAVLAGVWRLKNRKD